MLVTVIILITKINSCTKDFLSFDQLLRQIKKDEKVNQLKVFLKKIRKRNNLIHIIISLIYIIISLFCVCDPL